MPTHVLSPEERQREQLMLRELHKLHREHAHVGGPLLTAHAKKRERVPRIDADVNPFCVERQLADEYERLNFNKVQPGDAAFMLNEWTRRHHLWIVSQHE
jgi:hypothetical protein